jgi:hypothetical protein
VSSNFNCSYIAISSLTYIPFLPHLAFTPCELLSSLFVRRSSVHISHFNLLLRNHWVNCIQTLVEWSLDGPLPKTCPWYRLPTKMSAKRKIEKGEMKFRKIFSETTEPISTKLCWNDLWVVPFQKCVRHFRPLTKMAATAELNLT